MLLDAELRGRLERLGLQSRRRVRAMWSGGHRSVKLGESLDFADYREYSIGDDFRRIDHALWARLGVVLVRLFEAEQELPLRVVLDRSSSMDFGPKFVAARQLAAMISYLALTSGDRVYPFLTPGSEDRPIQAGPPMRHGGTWPALETWLEAAQPGGAGQLVPMARALAGDGATRGPTILVSDLLTEDWREALDVLAVIGGGVVLHILTIDELRPDLTGDLSLVDSETGREVEVSMSNEVIEAYATRLAGFLDEAQGRCRRAGLDYVLAPATARVSDDVLAALTRSAVIR